MSELDRREKLQHIIEAALDRNAHDPVAMDVHELTSYTDIIVVVTGNSDRQARSIADHISKTLKDLGDPPIGVEGLDEGNWILVDANDIIVHVFEHNTRTTFDLEGLWRDAPRIEFALPDAEEAATTP
jgi:ribosome-associated protein